MRIGIDVRKIKDFGIGVYIENLVKNLLLLDHENQYVLFFDPKDIAEYSFPENQVEKVINRSGKYSLGELLTLSWQSSRRKLDLFFSPHYVMPIFLKCRKVVTFHDLIHLKFPEYFNRPGAQAYAKFMFAKTTKSADKIIADSHHTKKDIVEILKVDSGKIEVIYPAADEAFERLKSDEEVKVFREERGIKKDYILYLGSDKPHKNLKNTLLAFSQVAGKTDLNLVICGVKSDKTRSPMQIWNDIGLKERITFLDFIPQKELPLLYTGAKLLIFPSLYEGFGFPVLEAFSCGTPVVASNSSSIPEVAGDAAFLVNPSNVDSISAGILTVLNDRSIRLDLIEKGKKRVGLFSWREASERVLKIFREAVGR